MKYLSMFPGVLVNECGGCGKEGGRVQCTKVTSLSGVNQCCSATSIENGPICTSCCSSGYTGETGLVLSYSTVLSSADWFVPACGVAGSVRPEERGDNLCRVQ